MGNDTTKLEKDINNTKDVALSSSGIDIERANTDYDYWNSIITTNTAHQSTVGFSLEAADSSAPQSDMLYLMEKGFIPQGVFVDEDTGATRFDYATGKRTLLPKQIAEGEFKEVPDVIAGDVDSSLYQNDMAKSMKQIVIEGANNGTLDANDNFNKAAVNNIIVGTKDNNELANKIADSNSSQLSKEAINNFTSSVEDENFDKLKSYSTSNAPDQVAGEFSTATGVPIYQPADPENDVLPNEPGGGVNDFVYKQDPETGDASVAENIYQADKKPEEFYHAHYKRNLLLDYDTPTYHWKMSMLTERDTVSAQEHINRGNRSDDGFSNWTPADSKIVIAETGGTVLSLNSAEIKTTAGPVNNGKRITGAVEFTLNILQPLNASFTDTLVNAAIALGLPDGLKATYLLELHFIGRVPAGSPHLGVPGEIINPIPLTERQFLIEIVSVDAQVDTNGAQYVIQAARAGDKGIRADHYQTDRPLQLNNLETVESMIQSLNETLNENELDKLAIEKSILDEYIIKLDDYAMKMIGKSELLNTDKLENVTTELSDAVQFDKDKKMFRIPEGTSIDRILEFGLSHSKELQRLAKGLKDDADADSSDAEAIDNYVKYIFHIKVDTINIAWDVLRNEYARTYIYTVSMFPTIRPEILPGTWNDPRLVEEEKIKALLKGDLSSNKSRPYFAMSKRYDYLFTGLNDKVLRFDIKYNNYFFFALHSYRSVFAGLDQASAKAKVTKATDTLIKFNKQRTEINNAWKAYTKLKADLLDKDLTQEQKAEQLEAKFDEFKAERKKLIELYVEGIENGTFEGDAQTVRAAQTLEYVNEPSGHPLYQNPSRSDVKDSVTSSQQGSLNNDPLLSGMTKQMYAELLDRKDIVQAIDSSKKPFQIMWGAMPSAFKSKFNADNETPGKGHFDAVLEATLSDFSADMVYMDMDIRGDVFWLESERDPANEHTMSMYEGENYLLFNAVTSAGEPDPNTGIATPGDEQGEQMLNGIYGVVTVTHRFENGQFTQNIRGVKEAFITDISKLKVVSEI